MKSTIVACVAVLILGLSGVAYSADSCTAKCEVVKNGTVEWENGVQVNYGTDITIYVSRTESVIVFINTKTQVVIVFDIKASLVLIYRFNAEFGIVINLQTGGCVKVKLDINLVINGDFTELRTVLDKAKTDIDSQSSEVIYISFTYIQNVSFDINAVFVSGSQTTIAEVKASYAFFFEISYNAVVVVGQDINFAGAIVIALVGQASEITIGIAKSFSIVVSAGVNLTFNFGILIVQSIQKASVSVFLEFQAAFQAVGGKVDDAIEEAKNGVSIDRTIKVGSLHLRFVIVLVRDYLEFALRLGQINIDIGYSGKTLAVLNAKANIAIVISGEYTFLYSYESKAGFLFYESNLVYITEKTIKSKISGHNINSGTLALFINANAKAIFESSTKITLKDFKAALESEEKFEAFAKANGIAHGKVVYKAFTHFSQAISSSLFGKYSLSITTTLRVSFSLQVHYKVDTTVYNNAIVTAVCTAISVVTKFSSSSSIFATLKITLGGSSD